MHYSVLVLTEESPDDAVITKMLAPFDSNRRVEPYITDSYAEVKMSMRHDADLLPSDEKAELLEALKRDDIGTIRYFNKKYDFMYYEDINKNGEGLSTYNPIAHWDAWQVGGPDCWLLNKDPLDSAPCMQLGRITRPDEADTEADIMRKFEKLYGIYKSQLLFDKQFRNGYPETYYPTFYDYLCYRMPYITVSNEEGWNDFSYRRHTLEGRRESCFEIYKLLSVYPQNYWLTVVDCHI